MRRAIGVSVFATIGLAVPAAAQDIPADCDCWVTEPGSAIEIPPLPADFFFPGSDPFPATVIDVEGLPLPGGIVTALCPPAQAMMTVWVDPHGTPVAPDDMHAVKQELVPALIDTVVCRPNDVTFVGVGVPEPVAIELVELSLKSVSPITVTGGGPPLWDVFVTEDGAQVPGSMTLIPAAIGAGTSSGASGLTGLPVNYQLNFVPLGGGVGIGVGGLSINFFGTNGNFSFAPPPPQVVTLGTKTAVAIGCGVLTIAVILLSRRRISARLAA